MGLRKARQEPEPEGSCDEAIAQALQDEEDALAKAVNALASGSAGSTTPIPVISVAAAASELCKTSGPKKGPPAPVIGEFPPACSSTGRRYYVGLAHHPSGPCIYSGQTTTLRVLGGSWVGHAFGSSPKGFASYEDAANYLVGLYPNLQEVRVLRR